MKQRSKLFLTLIASVCLAAFIMLAGCTSNSSANDEVTRNRTYMTQVNQIMTDIGTRLESFNDAVSRSDIVNMRTQADNAFRALDELNQLDVPDTLKDVHDEYVAGGNDLREALNNYIALYSEARSEGFDFSAFDTRLEAIQEKYDSGIDHFTNGDRLAAEKPNGTE